VKNVLAAPLGAVSSVTRGVLAWRPQNKRCLLGSADVQASDLHYSDVRSRKEMFCQLR
jgi:hypothetical protein